jgi:SAM-dependent methyltransferase
MQLNTIYKGIPIAHSNDEISTALEIGCGDGKFANFLQENGVTVTAVDIERSPNLNKDITFEMMKFENYTPDTVFDLVHARNVIPFFKDKPEQLKRLLTMGKYVFFTFFGPHDPWAEFNRTISKEDMVSVLKNVTVLYSKEEEYIGPTMKGDLKPWHIFTYVVKTTAA